VSFGSAAGLHIVIQAMSETPPVGTQVEVQGLKSRPDLNGKKGWVTAYDQDADRVEVTFEGSRDKIKVKPANAVPVAKLQAPPTDGLVVGVFVEIMGLQSRPLLNGKRGSIVGRDDAAGRVEVQLGTERLKIKPANAKIVKDLLCVGAEVEIVDLQGRPELNGRRGRIVGRDMDFIGNDRVEVVVECPNGEEHVKCKPSNAQIAVAKVEVDLSAAIAEAAAAARLKAKAAGLGDESERRWRDSEPEGRASQWDRAKPQSDNYGRSYEATRDRDSQRDSGRRDGNRDRDRRSDRSRSRRRSRSRSRSRPKPKMASVPIITSAGLRVQEDRTNDWVCACGERNFAKRSQCHRCKASRTSTAPTYSDVSHFRAQQAQASRAMLPPREPPMVGSRGHLPPMGGPLGTWTTAKDLLGQGEMDALRRRLDAKKRKNSSSSSSKSSSSEASAKKKKKKKKKQRSSSSSPEKSFGEVANSVKEGTSELDKLKDGALQKLLALREAPAETRKKAWRALLLEWHPDKHPEDKENATAVFQFLQKGKGLLDLSSC